MNSWKTVCLNSNYTWADFSAVNQYLNGFGDFDEGKFEKYLGSVSHGECILTVFHENGSFYIGATASYQTAPAVMYLSNGDPGDPAEYGDAEGQSDPLSPQLLAGMYVYAMSGDEAYTQWLEMNGIADEGQFAYIEDAITDAVYDAEGRADDNIPAEYRPGYDDDREDYFADRAYDRWRDEGFR